MNYHFDVQLKIGKDAERHLDRLFSQWYRIEELPLDIEQRVHADRLFVRQDDSQVMVEYKTDLMGHKTGNLVIETISADTHNTPGWVYTSQADMLVWWVVGLGEVLVAKMADVRAQLPEWQKRYQTVKIPNDGYHSIGLLVPIPVFKDLCIWIGYLTDEETSHDC